MARLSPEELQQRLTDLPSHGTRLTADTAGETWRFTAGLDSYLLHFFRRARPEVAPPGRLDPALRLFYNHQQLQKARVPALVPVAVLQGFVLGTTKGDAVILRAPPADAPRLDIALAENRHGNPSALAKDTADWLQKLRDAELGHADFSPAIFVLVDGSPVLTDATYLSRTPLNDVQLFTLGFRLTPLTTASQRSAVWRQLARAETSARHKPPRDNPLAPILQRRLCREATGDNASFTRQNSNGWCLHHARGPLMPRCWSEASRMRISPEDWQSQWPLVLAACDDTSRECFKNDASGQVWPMTLTLAGREVEVVVKRPLRKYWWRWLRDLVRGSDATRIWQKAWQLLAAGLPVEVPLLLARRRRFGYTLDALVVFARVPGTTLQQTPLDRLTPENRRLLFERLGRTLRLVERAGYAHLDAKAWNWIVTRAPDGTPLPVMLDLDSLRRFGPRKAGLARLQRALGEKPDTTEADLDHLLRAYKGP